MEGTANFHQPRPSTRSFKDIHTSESSKVDSKTSYGLDVKRGVKSNTSGSGSKASPFCIRRGDKTVPPGVGGIIAIPGVWYRLCSKLVVRPGL